MSRILSFVLMAACCALAGCGDGGEPLWLRVDSKTTSSLHAIEGSGPQDIWAVGDEGTIIHWDGTAWSPVMSGTRANLEAVHVLGPRDAWAVGYETILHWDGAKWSEVEVDLTRYHSLTGVWASSPSDVWIAARIDDSRELKGPLHFDGTTWVLRVFPEDAPVDPAHVWGSSANDVWVSLVEGPQLKHWNGSTWSVVSPQLTLWDGWRALRGSGASEAWAVGSTAQGMEFLRKDAQGWNRVPVDTAIEGDEWNAVWGKNGSVWVAGAEGTVARFDGMAWSQELPPDDLVPDLTGLWGASEADIWAVGESGLVARRTPPRSP